MAYPSSLDSFTSPTSTQTLNSPSHSTIETAQNVALAAVETKLGVDSSVVTTTIDYLVKNTSSSNPGHKHTFTSLSDFTVSSSVSGDILQYNGTKYVNTPASTIPIKFGGTGADGALSITSGTTTIDLGGLTQVIKNYTSISITGSGALAFSNPHANGTYIILKSVGAVTITTSGSVSTVGMGATKGTNGVVMLGTAPGLGGTGAGAGGTAGSTASGYGLTDYLYPKFIPFLIGAGGGDGSSGPGVGGRGGGALYIECGGALNFTTATITVAGVAGTVVGATGGGGGGAGSVVILYNTLTANTGTVTKTGGAGGVGGSANGGGGGGSATVGTAGGTGSGLGGAGGTGFSLVAKNTEFA